MIEVNELQKRRVIGKLQHHLGPLRDKKIALLGLAFKPDTDDMREASSLVLALALAPREPRCAAYDPVAPARRGVLGAASSSPTTPEALAGADAAVIVTEWNEFRRCASPAMRDAMANAAADRRPQPARPRRGCRGGLRVRGSVGRAAASDATQRASRRRDRA